jgi:hypothetical protein
MQSREALTLTSPEVIRSHPTSLAVLLAGVAVRCYGALDQPALALRALDRLHNTHNDDNRNLDGPLHVYVDAATETNKRETKNPTPLPLALLNHAVVALSDGMPLKALELYREVEAALPDPSHVQRLVSSRVIHGLRKAGLFADAAAVFARSLRLNSPDQPATSPFDSKNSNISNSRQWNDKNRSYVLRVDAATFEEACFCAQRSGQDGLVLEWWARVQAEAPLSPLLTDGSVRARVLESHCRVSAWPVVRAFALSLENPPSTTTANAHLSGPKGRRDKSAVVHPDSAHQDFGSDGSSASSTDKFENDPVCAGPMFANNSDNPTRARVLELACPEAPLLLFERASVELLSGAHDAAGLADSSFNTYVALCADPPTFSTRRLWRENASADSPEPASLASAVSSAGKMQASEHHDLETRRVRKPAFSNSPSQQIKWLRALCVHGRSELATRLLFLCLDLAHSARKVVSPLHPRIDTEPSAGDGSVNNASIPKLHNSENRTSNRHDVLRPIRLAIPGWTPRDNRSRAFMPTPAHFAVVLNALWRETGRQNEAKNSNIYKQLATTTALPESMRGYQLEQYLQRVLSAWHTYVSFGGDNSSTRGQGGIGCVLTPRDCVTLLAEALTLAESSVSTADDLSPNSTTLAGMAIHDDEEKGNAVDAAFRSPASAGRSSRNFQRRVNWGREFLRSPFGRPTHAYKLINLCIYIYKLINTYKHTRAYLHYLRYKPLLHYC